MIIRRCQIYSMSSPRLFQVLGKVSATNRNFTITTPGDSPPQRRKRVASRPNYGGSVLYPDISTPQSALRCTIADYNYTTRRGRLLQYTIPTGMLRALAVLQCRAKEQSTASNGDWGVHVRVSTTLCSFRYQDIHGQKQITEEEDHRLNILY